MEVDLELAPVDPNYHYSVKELAFLWNMSTESIRRLFEKEPGTLIFKIQTSGRRTYRNFRIPGNVAPAGEEPDDGRTRCTRPVWWAIVSPRSAATRRPESSCPARFEQNGA